MANNKHISSDEYSSFTNISNDISALYSVMRECRTDIETCTAAFRKNEETVEKLKSIVEKLEDIQIRLTECSEAKWISSAMKGSGYAIRDEQGNPIVYTYEQFETAVNALKTKISAAIGQTVGKLNHIEFLDKDDFKSYIVKTHDDFNKAVPLFREAQQINGYLKEILVHAHPAKMNRVGEDQLPSFELTDEGYLSHIELLKSEANPFTRMTILQMMIKTIVEGIESMRSKEEKLTRMANGAGATSAEKHIAYDKRRAVRASIEVLRKRLESCASIMCELRKHIVETVLKFSQSTYKMFNEGDPALANAVFKYDVKSSASDLITLDDRIKMDNFKRDKKGRSTVWNMR